VLWKTDRYRSDGIRTIAVICYGAARNQQDIVVCCLSELNIDLYLQNIGGSGMDDERLFYSVLPNGIAEKSSAMRARQSLAGPKKWQNREKQSSAGF
jgi:hypothetical protein